MIFLRGKTLWAILLVICCLVLFYGGDWVNKWMYPLHYKREIAVAAQKNQVDPLLIAAIIRVESNFKADNTSRKGAVGMMQIMPETAGWLVEMLEYPPDMMKSLDQAEVNIAVGAAYLKWLHDQFIQSAPPMNKFNELAVIAAAYNAGPTKVLTWLQSDIWDGTYGQLAQVPYGETRHYVQRVVYYYKKYQAIYAEDFS